MAAMPLTRSAGIIGIALALACTSGDKSAQQSRGDDSAGVVGSLEGALARARTRGDTEAIAAELVHRAFQAERNHRSITPAESAIARTLGSAFDARARARRDSLRRITIEVEAAREVADLRAADLGVAADSLPLMLAALASRIEPLPASLAHECAVQSPGIIHDALEYLSALKDYKDYVDDIRKAEAEHRALPPIPAGFTFSDAMERRLSALECMIDGIAAGPPESLPHGGQIAMGDQRVGEQEAKDIYAYLQSDVASYESKSAVLRDFQGQLDEFNGARITAVNALHDLLLHDPAIAGIPFYKEQLFNVWMTLDTKLGPTVARIRDKARSKSKAVQDGLNARQKRLDERKQLLQTLVDSFPRIQHEVQAQLYTAVRAMMQEIQYRYGTTSGLFLHGPGGSTVGGGGLAGGGFGQWGSWGSSGSSGGNDGITLTHYPCPTGCGAMALPLSVTLTPPID